MTPEKDLYAFFFFAGKNLGLRKGKKTLSKFEIFATFQGLDKIWLSTGTCDHFEAISTRRQLSPSPPPPYSFSLASFLLSAVSSDNAIWKAGPRRENIRNKCRDDSAMRAPSLTVGSLS